MALAEKLRAHRQNRGLSQNEVANQLNVSRQSVSKWETGRGYPDIDNLVLLSEIYEVSIDDLLKENEQLKQQIDVNNSVIDEHKKRLEWLYQQDKEQKDEGLLLLIAILILSIAAPLGLVITPFLLKRNKKSNTLYKLIIVAGVCCLLLNLYFSFILFGDYFRWGQEIEVEYIP